MEEKERRLLIRRIVQMVKSANLDTLRCLYLFLVR